MGFHPPFVLWWRLRSVMPRPGLAFDSWLGVSLSVENEPVG